MYDRDIFVQKTNFHFKLALHGININYKGSHDSMANWSERLEKRPSTPQSRSDVAEELLLVVPVKRASIISSTRSSSSSSFFLFSFFAHRTLNNNLWLQYIDLVWVSTQFSSGPYKSTITVGLVSSRHIPIQQQQQLERERQLNRRYLQSISYKQI